MSGRKAGRPKGKVLSGRWRWVPVCGWQLLCSRRQDEGNSNLGKPKRPARHSQDLELLEGGGAAPRGRQRACGATTGQEACIEAQEAGCRRKPAKGATTQSVRSERGHWHVMLCLLLTIHAVGGQLPAAKGSMQKVGSGWAPRMPRWQPEHSLAVRTTHATAKHAWQRRPLPSARRGSCSRMQCVAAAARAPGRHSQVGQVGEGVRAGPRLGQRASDGGLRNCPAGVARHNGEHQQRPPRQHRRYAAGVASTNPLQPACPIPDCSHRDCSAGNLSFPPQDAGRVPAATREQGVGWTTGTLRAGKIVAGNAQLRLMQRAPSAQQATMQLVCCRRCQDAHLSSC